VSRLARYLFLFFSCTTLIACSDREPNLSAENAAPAPATRIVTLSPHLAELMFAIGADDLLVGVSAYSDYPLEATELPVIGDAFNIDQEQLTILEPDLLLAWETGTPAHVVDDLSARGFRVEVIPTKGLAGVPSALRTLGELTDHQVLANAAANSFENELQTLAEESRELTPISVFYQVDARPLYTINGDHYISELIETCGGFNIFSDLDGLAPLVSVEAVLEREPEILLASSDAGPNAFIEWDRWTDIAANKYGNRFLMPANEIGRPTLRLLIAARAVCNALATGRLNREKYQGD
jgi:iron complex transport system substrate-binding protein